MSLEHRKNQLAALSQHSASINHAIIQLEKISATDENLENEKTRIIEKCKKTLNAINLRTKRISQDHINIAIVGLEKQGKSSFINALINNSVLPTAGERCTWATTTISNSEHYGVDITFYTTKEYKTLTEQLISDCGGSNSITFPIQNKSSESEDPATFKSQAYQELLCLSSNWDDIKNNLDAAPISQQDISKEKLNQYLKKYVSIVDPETGKEQGYTYAVKHVAIRMPLEKNNQKFMLNDLPGINAPGNRAENFTNDAIKNSADVIIVIKNPLKNPDLVRDEVNLLSLVAESDTSIPIIDKTFFILTQSDEKHIDHGRDNHKTSSLKLIERAISKDKVFFCSSRAELFKSNPSELSEDWTELKLKQATERIGELMGGSPTTGFEKIKSAIYNYISNDFPKLEIKAFDNLNDEIQSCFQNLDRFVERTEKSINSQGNATPEEIQTFTKLWAPQDAQSREKSGLSNCICRALARRTHDLIHKNHVESTFMEDVLSKFENLKNSTISNITYDSIMDEGDYGAGHNPVFREKINSFRQRLRRKIKIELRNFADIVSEETSNVAKDLWNTAITTADTCNKNATLSKGIHGEAATTILDTVSKKDQIRSGFNAILAAAAYSPTEYLLINDDEYQKKRERITEKINIYKHTVSNQLINSLNPNKRDKLIEILNKNDGTIASFIKNNSEDIAKMLTLAIKPSLYPVVSEVFANSSTFWSSNKKTAASTENGSKNNTSQENEISNLKNEVEVLFEAIKTMLIDEDFGFTSYYFASIEQIRIELEDMVRNGRLSELAFLHRREIWADEKAFTATERIQEQSKNINTLKNSLRDRWLSRHETSQPN